MYYIKEYTSMLVE